MEAAVQKRGRGRPRSERADRAILEAALELLSEQGYARMSMDAVAARAGVTKPTVYLRYKSKGDLATAALAAHAPGDPPAETGDLRADLIAHLRHLRRGIERSVGLAMVGNVLAEERHTPELLASFRERVLEPRRNQLRGVLERARDRGEVSPGADLDAALHMLTGAYYAQYLAGDPFNLRWPEAEVDVMLDGLREAAGGRRQAAEAVPGTLYGGRPKRVRRTRRSS
jgi:AcrR family transcriptional regulator